MFRDNLTPEQVNDLTAELSELMDLHSKAIYDARYAVLSADEAKAFDQRRKRMIEIRRLLDPR
jgi:hypothetical protein